MKKGSHYKIHISVHRILSSILVFIFLLVLYLGSVLGNNQTQIKDIDFSTSEHFLDYKFYSINEDDSHIVAFFPDNSVFTFETGTYFYDTSGGKQEFVLNTPSGEERYTVENPTEDGHVTLISGAETFELKTHKSEGGFLNGFLFEKAPFESYTTFKDQHSDMEITFKEDGTFVRQEHFLYWVSNSKLIVTDGPHGPHVYNIRYDKKLSSIDVSYEESKTTNFTLQRIDNFDENGIEEVSYVGLLDRHFKYKRVLIEPYFDNPNQIKYMVIYTNDLGITIEKIDRDMLSATFIPATEKDYEFEYLWSYMIDEEN